MAEIQDWLTRTGIKSMQGETPVETLVFADNRSAMLLTDKRMVYIERSKATKILIGLLKDVSALEFNKEERSIGLLVSGIIMAIAAIALAIGTVFVDSELIKFSIIGGCGICVIATAVLLSNYYTSGGASFKCWIGEQKVEDSVPEARSEAALNFINRFYELIDSYY